MKLKIHIISESTSDTGGAAKCAFQLYEQMNSDGLDVKITSLYGNGGLINTEFFTYLPIKKVIELLLLPVVLVLFTLKNDSEHIIACHFKSIIIGGFYKFFFKRKSIVVAWVHTNLIKYFSDNKNRLFFCYFIRVSINLCDKICFVGKHQADIHSNNFHNRTPAFIHNIVTLNDSGKNCHDDKKFIDKSLKLLYVGRLSNEKRLDIIIDAVKILIDKKYDLNLNIVGVGPELKGLTKKICDYSIQNNVNLLGFKKPFEYYVNSDLLLLSSILEGFPLVIQEAASYGLPVLSTDCLTGPRELLTDYTKPLDMPISKAELCPGGVLVPVDITPEMYASAIELIMSNEEHYKKASRYLFIKSQLYNPSTIVRNWLDLFFELK